MFIALDLRVLKDLRCKLRMIQSMMYFTLIMIEIELVLINKGDECEAKLDLEAMVFHDLKFLQGLQLFAHPYRSCNSYILFLYNLF